MKSVREIQLTPHNIAWEKEFSKEAATLTTIMSAQVLGFIISEALLFPA